MHNKKYSSIFITNIPSFYKLNLYNRLSCYQNIFVVFLDDTHHERNSDFYQGERNFEWISLANKSILAKVIFILKLVLRSTYKEVVLCGWDEFLYWITIFISQKSKNAVIVESTYIESMTTGIKGLMKKIFISRISKSYVSGRSQKKLMDNLGFVGEYKITKGVGVFNIIPTIEFQMRNRVTNFLFVGRLSPEKNLDHLISIFNKYPHLTLNIVGFGPLEDSLKKMANENIIFHGAINNKELPKIFEVNDVFILPSLREVWGLVVEEALNNGLPVIVSDRVGCVEEIIIENVNGLVFSLEDPFGLDKSLEKIQDLELYNQMRRNISKIDFNEIAEKQVQAYLS